MKLNLNGPFTPFPLLQQEPTITDYKSFWAWFTKHERRFLEMLKIDEGTDNEFNAIFRERLMEVWHECDFTTNKRENGLYEIVFNISHQVRRAVIAEEVVACAPLLEHWLFSAFTKPFEDAEFRAEFDGFTLDSKDVYFFSTEHPGRPDMVDVTVTFKNHNKTYNDQLNTSCAAFIKHIVGELEMLTQFDRLEIRPAATGDPQPIPIAKLPAFLHWREKEFVERYKDVFYDKKLDRGPKYLMLQSAPTSNGFYSITKADRFVMRWDETASYPWILTITLSFNGNEKHMPNEVIGTGINSFQKDLGNMLEPYEGYLFLLHDTYDNVNTSYIACNEFRIISKITEDLLKKYDDQFVIGYSITKDKYWAVVDMYKPACLPM